MGEFLAYKVGLSRVTAIAQKLGSKCYKTSPQTDYSKSAMGQKQPFGRSTASFRSSPESGPLRSRSGGPREDMKGACGGVTVAWWPPRPPSRIGVQLICHRQGRDLPFLSRMYLPTGHESSLTRRLLDLPPSKIPHRKFLPSSVLFAANLANCQ
jgi:hypothetical protein